MGVCNEVYAKPQGSRYPYRAGITRMRRWATRSVRHNEKGTLHVVLGRKEATEAHAVRKP